MQEELPPVPPYKFLGGPKRKKCRGKWTAEYYQDFRLLGSKQKLSVQLCKDKGQSISMTKQAVETKIRRSLNLVNPAAELSKQPIEEHLIAYQEFKLARGHSPRDTRQVIQRIERVAQGTKAKVIQDLTPVMIDSFLAGLRRRGKHGSEQIAIHWRSSLKAFTHWLYSNNRILVDPLANLRVKQREVQRLYVRRACTPEEFARLLDATWQSYQILYQLTGYDRWHLYALASNTGWRARELGSLTPRSFSFGEPTTIVLDCTISKRRRHDVAYISDELGQVFEDYLKGKPKEEPIWPGQWRLSAAKMLRVDLIAAEIEPETDGGVLDFHAVGRTSFITALVLSNTSWGIIQRLARLSTPTLLERYFRPDQQELVEAVAGLPFKVGERAPLPSRAR